MYIRRKNICTNCRQWLDIERTYTVHKLTSSRVTTHMQYDQMVIDFGFITNTGAADFSLEGRLLSS